MVKINWCKIVYFESDGNYTAIMTVNKYKTIVGINLGSIMNELQRQLGALSRNFVRVGKRHIINCRYFCFMNVLKQQLVLSDNERFVLELSISRDALKKFKSDYFDSNNKEPRNLMA